jgi:hypothetical protein
MSDLPNNVNGSWRSRTTIACDLHLLPATQLFRDFPWPVVCSKRHPILLLPLRCGLHFHQDLIECRTIKEPAVGDNDVDFLGVPNVVERVCAEQH